MTDIERKARLKAAVFGAPAALQRILAQWGAMDDELRDHYLCEIDELRSTAHAEDDGADAEYTAAVAVMDAAVEAFFAAPKETP